MKVQAQSQSGETGGLIGVEPEFFARHNGVCYRAPTDLQVTPTPGGRFLVIGGCLAEPFALLAPTINSGFRGDFLLMNNFDSLPQIPRSQAEQYDFQIVHIPLRSILGSAYFRLPDDGSEHEHFLEMTEDCLARYLCNVLQLNVQHKLLSFVLGFFVPQQNPLGRFQPRFELRNIMHFVERLNIFLAGEIAKYQNACFVDIDQISAGIGKKYCQDDMVWSFTHGTTLSNGDSEHDLNRIQPTASMQHYYSPKWYEFFEALLHEIFAMWRSTRQLDAVKLVAVDLDDTLWRGIAAEGTLGILEGWPMGFMETLVLLKKRGILLAIVSRNDEQFIQSNWNQIVQGQISLDDFVVRKINFGSKAQNLAEIIASVNLLPRNVVMIDDNPAERAAIGQQLPGVRVLGSHPYYLKRILLWAPETQQNIASQESASKTELVRGQLQREDVRKNLSHEQFLQTLELVVSVSVIRRADNVFLNRALELLNKTNQFNMTGARYTFEQCHQLLETGCELHVLHAEDRFTQYGLIGAAWVSDNCVEQFVMSCRALGLGIEDAFLAHLSRQLAVAKWTVVLGKLVTTDANMACREVYRRNGFTQPGGDAAVWSRSLLDPLEGPRHVRLVTGPAEKLSASLGTATTAK